MAGDTTVRIPLDYYRILGLPIQATAEQLKQSHRDRTLQVPRREYSELAIDARRQLLDMAYDVLGNSARRAEYDQEFLASSKSSSDGPENVLDPDANVPTIDIDNSLLVGALLILLELGEYELVLRLGRPYIKRDPQSTEGQQLKNQPALPDIILTLAVACLELGREEWQQNHYEHAAESLETGRELLLKEDLLPVLRAEIQADLYKLRPYRCLELIARPLDQKSARQEGINLLRGMLQDRGGIDGADDDLSGLGVDDFLRFVQQLRGYMTAAEQQEVFEAEAQRPSAVGTYLAVYALLARGFAQHQPALIRRAKQMLLRLSGRQDVHLEQAVCAVLLGQTEEASRALELSQEHEPLAFIREHSKGSPDLLPGLCLYAENWLQQEVFPFFRDLDQEPATLKDYFADSTVQSYLENLPLENERSQQPATWDSASNSRVSAGYGDTYQGTTPAIGADAAAVGVGSSFSSSPATATLGQSAIGEATVGQSSIGQSGTGETVGARRPGRLGTAAIAGAAGAIGAAGFAGGASIVDKISRMSPAGQLGARPDADSLPEQGDGGDRSDLSALRERRSRRSSPKWDRVALVIFAGALCIGIALFLASSIYSAIRGGGSGGSPALEGEPLDIGINEPPIEIEAPETATTADIATDDAAGIAEATISRWLETKRAAYSSEHDTSNLENVLTGGALSGSQADLQSSVEDDWYVDYTHGDVNVISVEPEDATEADQLTVEAEITESATVYEGGQRSDRFSYTEDVNTFVYDLVREGDQWLIEQIR
ncbi:MAG: IMS domain-containing protein [Cyanobacteria bacterium J06614_10]